MLNKRYKKIITAVLSCAMVIGMTACGGNKDSGNTDGSDVAELEEGIYSFEEITLTDNKNSMVSDFYLKGNELYYTMYVYPEYPDEYYEDLDKIKYDPAEIARHKATDGDAGASDEDADAADGDTGAADDGIENTSLDATSLDKGGNGNNSGDSSGDDLTGDLDDIFGDGSDKPDDSQTDSDGSQTGSDDVQDTGDDSMTMEEFEEKYKDYQAENKMYKYNLETEEKTELFDLGVDFSVDNYYVNDDDQIIMIKEIYNDAKQSQGIYSADYHITVLDMDGNQVSDNIFTDNIEEAGSDEFYIDKIIFGIEGSIYLAASSGSKGVLYELNTEGAVEKKINIDGYLNSIVMDNEGRIVVTIYGDNDDGTKCQYVDFDKGALGEEVQGLFDESGMGEVMNGSGSIPFFVKDSTGLFKYDAETHEKKAILKWMDCGLIGDNVNQVVPIGGNRIICTCYGDESVRAGILVRSEGGETDKKVIKVASIYSDSELQEKIITYNKSNPEYKIEYTSYDNAENAETAFANDIIAGNIPDIIDLSSVDISNYVSKGILEDLTPYIEKDADIGSDYFIDGILDSMAIDGKNYYLANSIYINTLAVKASDTAKYKDGWTAADVMEYYNSKPEGTKLFEGDSRDGVMYNMVQNNINEFINWDTGEVRLDDGQFKSILEFCNKFGNDYEYDDNEDTHKEIKEGRLLTYSSYISDMSEIQMLSQLFDGDIKYIGYPSSDKKGSFIGCPGHVLGISSTSEFKEQAWEFLKSDLTGKSEMAYSYGIPVAKKDFDAFIKKETTTEEYTTEDGEIVKPKDETYGYNNFEVKIGPATDKEVQILKSLIDNGKINYANYSINEIISEEADNYFTGSKSLDDTVKVLQDKLDKYVNENK